MLASGKLIDPADELHADLPAPSFYETATNVDPRRVKLGLRPSASRPASLHGAVTDFESATISLLRVLSFCFALDQLVMATAELHAMLLKPAKPSLQFHLLQVGSIFRRDKPVSLAEIRAKLDGEAYTAPRRTLERRVKELELLFRSPRSLSALKTACAYVACSRHVESRTAWARNARDCARCDVAKADVPVSTSSSFSCLRRRPAASSLRCARRIGASVGAKVRSTGSMPVSSPSW